MRGALGTGPGLDRPGVMLLQECKRHSQSENSNQSGSLQDCAGTGGHRPPRTGCDTNRGHCAPSPTPSLGHLVWPAPLHYGNAACLNPPTPGPNKNIYQDAQSSNCPVPGWHPGRRCRPPLGPLRLPQHKPGFRNKPSRSLTWLRGACPLAAAE